MIFADGFKQACLAGVLEHGHMNICQVYFDADLMQFFHQTHEHVRAGHIDLFLRSRVEDHGVGWWFHFGKHGFHTIPDSECIGIVQLLIEAHD